MSCKRVRPPFVLHDMSASATSETPTPLDTPATEYGDPHQEHAAEERQAYKYWGYLFKADKTGTEKLKSLLRGLKDVMVGALIHLQQRRP